MKSLGKLCPSNDIKPFHHAIGSITNNNLGNVYEPRPAGWCKIMHFGKTHFIVFLNGSCDDIEFQVVRDDIPENRHIHGDIWYFFESRGDIGFDIVFIEEIDTNQRIGALL